MNSTIALGVAAIALALLFRSQTEGLPIDALRLPALLIWIVIVLAVMMIGEELIKRRKASTAQAAPDDDEPLKPINWPVLAAFSVAALTYVALIPIVGHLIITPVYLAGGLLASKTLSAPKAVAVGLGITAVTWLIFIRLLQLPIPLYPSLN